MVNKQTNSVSRGVSVSTVSREIQRTNKQLSNVSYRDTRKTNLHLGPIEETVLVIRRVCFGVIRMVLV